MEVMDKDTYEGFAERYDWMKENSPDREGFFKDLFTKYEVSTILDCACGTGRDAIMLQSLGFELTGSDLSDAMLEQAERNIAEAASPIKLKKSDFRLLEQNFEEKFDAVVCLSNAINEPLADADTVKALSSMIKVLKPGGVLVFDQGQTDASMVNPPQFAPIVNTRDYSRLFTMTYTQEQMTVNIFDFIHSADKSDFKYTTIRYRLRLQDDWHQILNQLSLAEIRFLGGWDGTVYDKKSSGRLIVVAQK